MAEPAAVEAVLDVLAPRKPEFGDKRFAIFEWGHETTPTDTELRELAERIADAIGGGKYTLAEASKIFGRGKCASQGHDVLWIPTRYQSDTPNTPGPLYACTQCSERCLVIYPLDRVVLGEYSFIADRRVALRKQCAQPAAGSQFRPGHQLVHLDREEWVCSRCDALITFQEKW